MPGVLPTQPGVLPTQRSGSTAACGPAKAAEDGIIDALAEGLSHIAAGKRVVLQTPRLTHCHRLQTPCASHVLKSLRCGSSLALLEVYVLHWGGPVDCRRIVPGKLVRPIFRVGSDVLRRLSPQEGLVPSGGPGGRFWLWKTLTNTDLYDFGERDCPMSQT